MKQVSPAVRTAAEGLSALLDSFAEPDKQPERGIQDVTFLQWCRRLAADGMKVDGKPFSLDDRPSLIPIYESIPSDIASAKRKTVVVMKSAQMGLTILEMLADVYFALRFEPCVIGLFLPEQSLAGDKSNRRMINIIRSIPEVHRKLTRRITPEGGVINIGEGNIMTRQFGDSTMHFLWSSSKIGTESRPMDIVSLDEVQQISLSEIDRIQERMSASEIRFRLMLSTARIPDNDIHFWYKNGSMKSWFTKCSYCHAESDLAQHWPGVCVYNTGQVSDAPLNDWVYVCPECGGWVEDPQRDGRFIAANPDATIESFHISQIISPSITPRDMAEAWNRAETGDQRASFWQRKLGLPYVDRSQLPVTMADCLACVAEGLAIGLTWQPSGHDTFMGIDQMGSFVVCVIKRRLPDNRQAVVHIEAVFNDNPFERCGELMDQYGVALCGVEILPNVNDARRFASKFRGRVFLAKYATSGNSDMLAWGDAPGVRSDMKTAEEDRERYSVTIQQYKMMQTALYRIRNKQCLFPDPALLEQDVIDHGERKRINITRDWAFSHFCKTALVVEQDEETRTNKPKVVKIGIDPHFSFANMLCDAVYTRVHGASTFIIPESGARGERPRPDTPLGEKVTRNMPGFPVHVANMMDQGYRPGTCSGCVNFNADINYCNLRKFTTEATAVSCELFDPK